MATPVYINGLTTDLSKCLAEESRFGGTSEAALVIAPGNVGYIAASEGHVLAIAAVDTYGLDVGTFHRVPQPMAKGAPGVRLEINGEWRRVRPGRRLKEEISVAPISDNDGRFPDFQKVLPEIADCLTLRIDWRYFEALAKALTTDEDRSLTLYVPQGKRQVKDVMAVQGKAGIGALVPVNINEQEDVSERLGYMTQRETFSAAWTAAQESYRQTLPQEKPV